MVAICHCVELSLTWVALRRGNAAGGRAGPRVETSRANPTGGPARQTAQHCIELEETRFISLRNKLLLWAYSDTSCAKGRRNIAEWEWKSSLTFPYSVLCIDSPQLAFFSSWCHLNQDFCRLLLFEYIQGIPTKHCFDYILQERDENRQTVRFRITRIICLRCQISLHKHPPFTCFSFSHVRQAVCKIRLPRKKKSCKMILGNFLIQFATESRSRTLISHFLCCFTVSCWVTYCIMGISPLPQ